MIVVSNTSPLTNLAAIGRFELLRLLFQRLTIAEAVRDELNARGARWPGAAEVDAAGWIERAIPTNRPLVEALRRDLDQGEAETIALAVERGAGLVILDERDGRHAAQQLGLRVVGVVGVLIQAKRTGHLAAIRPELDALRSRAGFYLGEGVYRQALSSAGEG